MGFGHFPSLMEQLWSIYPSLIYFSLDQLNLHTISIVFVHGLTGNRESTWTHKKTKTFWPQKLLPQDLPSARILTFGYDADIVEAINPASSNTLRDHGNSLANDLALRRMKSRTVGENACIFGSSSLAKAEISQNQRPLIFVAHSLGGLVVEQVYPRINSHPIEPS